ncbi:MAG: LacI family DNA-binding transcriptional regulator [Actinomycetota bacterium]|nr:LacI family DNA-binding transcriptional regulator [Actinomycetota bacterium]
MERRPTIHDVAALAGVSKSLVSLVLQGSPRVSEERRQVVLSAVEELSYRPNRLARQLATNRTRTVGAVVADLHNPFFHDVLDGLQAEADKRGYRVLIGTGGLSSAEEVAVGELLLELRVEGLVLLAHDLPPRLTARLAAAGPCVVVARGPSRGVAADVVVNDDLVGMRLAVGHLVQLGHRDMAHVAAATAAGRVRAAAFRQAVSELAPDLEVTVLLGGMTEEAGYGGAAAALARSPRPTALLMANDIAAIGAFNAADDAGLRIPEDVSVVGYDNTEMAATRHISLTTVDQPRQEMGRLAFQSLWERVEEGRTRSRNRVVTPTLVVRSSTAEPPQEPRRRARCED